MTIMKELITALIKAKQNIKSPVKNRKAMYGRYADLEAVIGVIEQPLWEQGLFLEQRVVQADGLNFLRTTIWHAETGDSIHSDFPVVTKDANDPQKLGGSVTYARRYGIITLLTLVADDDDDGNTAAGKLKDGTPPKATPPVTKPANAKLPDNMVTALYKEFGDMPDSQVIAEIRKLINREVKSLYELTEAEARISAGHARKLKAGAVERLA
jgi:hypothetical protein